MNNKLLLSFSRWGFTMRWSRGKWMWLWSSWGTQGQRDTHIFPLACSTWFAIAPPLGGRRVRGVLPRGTHASGRECDTWCLPSRPQNLHSLLLSETLMDCTSPTTPLTQMFEEEWSLICIQYVSIERLVSKFYLFIHKIMTFNVHTQPTYPQDNVK